MQVVSEYQHRALAFIDACGKSGYRPTYEEVQLWLDNPTHAPGTKPGSLITQRLSQALLNAFLTAGAADGPTRLEHLLTLRWISDSEDRVSLTTLGRALLTSAEIVESVDADGTMMMLDTEDQFAYAKLIGYLNQAGEGLLVDPYFRLPQLLTILNGTSLSRIMLSKQHSRSKADRAELMIALQSPALPRKIEIRASSDNALHDRLIIGEDDKVWILGTSLNSVGSVNTSIIPVPTEGGGPLRDLAERLWANAEPVVSSDVGEVDDLPE